MNKKTIAVFSGNRAEYGLIKPILEALKNNKNFEYKLLVSGAHLDKNFGKTIEEIKKDNFKIYSEVKIEMKDYNLTSTPLAISSGIKSLTPLLKKIQPNFFLVYADRFEGFSAIITSTQMNIPTIHVEGGDITEGGAFDDSVRHAMTKLSHIHFTTNNEATKRILAMGEEKWRVKTVGFPAIDLIKNKRFYKEEEITKKIRIKFDKPTILFTQHSVTTTFEQTTFQITQSLKALKKISLKDVQIIITYPNNDLGGKIIIKEIKKYKKENNIFIFKSLGSEIYHGILSLKKQGKNIVCAGNSSSGIKETAIFGCPTLNIGSRQKNRMRANNVIDSEYDSNEIYRKLLKCLYDKRFIDKCKKTPNPYGGGKAGKKIVDYLQKLNFSKKKILTKKHQIKI